MRRTPGKAITTGLFCASLAAHPGVATAADGVPPQAEDADDGSNGANPQVLEARETFRSGVGAAREGRWRDALAAFERSNRLRPHVVTLYNIGFCEKKLGHDTRARQAFTEALAETDNPGVAHLPEAMSSAARTALEEIHAELSTAAITVRVPGAKVLVDGRPLERGSVSNGVLTFVAGTREPGPPEDVPESDISVDLDPGTHVFSLIHGDIAEPDLVRTVDPGNVVTITFDVASASTPAALPTPASEHAPVARRGHSKWPLFVSFGAGGAGVVTGAVFLGLAVNERAELRDACPSDRCPKGREGELSRFGTYSDVATGAFIAGVVGFAAGGYLWLASRSASTKQRSSASHGVYVEPWIGTRAFGLLGEF